jgi:phosphoribosylformimino-5-aminoimidazole carboxamide ribonucleotide (ProFAR) isomerase
MDLYARINILGGLSVRLPRGGLEEAIALDNDPIGRARNWVQQGVDYLQSWTSMPPRTAITATAS